jgi:two-component system OmpR family response regulator
MLTARDASRDRVQGLDLGAADYLIKRFDLEELFARVRALIRRAAGVSRTIMQIGSVRIDIPARQVTLRGESVPLTPREYGLLEFLAMHRGEVVSRTSLYEHLFDENESTLPTCLMCMFPISEENSVRNLSSRGAGTVTASDEIP